MFIGAGFSKDIIGPKKALNWLELIKKTSEELDIEFPKEEELIGISLPELATKQCKRLMDIEWLDYEESKTKFKNKICELTNWLPEEKEVDLFKERFEGLKPSWIITTNYDLVLETILTGKCKSLSSNDYLSAPAGIIPIYHIHGIRRESDTIIITQDDYIPIFRPNEYRQTKLAMTIRESTKLVLGYGLGDMNVLSALDWSKNIYTNKNEYPHEIIQAFWTENPKQEPYKDENGNIIIEISDIGNFLDEIIKHIKTEEEKYSKKIEELSEIIGNLREDNVEFVEKFKKEGVFRVELINLLTEFEYSMIDPYIDFLTKCIDEIWSEARSDGGFKFYYVHISILLDIIINYPYINMSSKLFKIVCNKLDNVLNYISMSPNRAYYGQAWDASDSWHSRKKDIPDDMKKELYCYSKENMLIKVTKFLEPEVLS
ncbi:SIR2 family protein [Clostridium perfringens]|nr:SIR2 family protein [Clostridium perfringens]